MWKPWKLRKSDQSEKISETKPPLKTLLDVSSIASYLGMSNLERKSIVSYRII